MKWFSKISKSDIIIVSAVLAIIGVDLFSTHIFLGNPFGKDDAVASNPLGVDKEPVIEQTPVMKKEDRLPLPPKEPPSESLTPKEWPSEKNTSRFISNEDWNKLVDTRIFLKREPKVDTPKVLPQKKKKITKPLPKPLVIKRDEPIRYININGRVYELNRRSNIFLTVFKWIGGLF